MARQNLITYRDMQDHLIEYLGGDTDLSARTSIRRAIQEAYRCLANKHNWSYLYAKGRVNVSAAYSTGTVAYDHTGGASERMLTLTDGTWPTWAAFGAVIINDVVYEVATRESNSVITLSRTSNPGEDIAAGETYTIYRDTYPMPTDFRKSDLMHLVSDGGEIDYVSAADWLNTIGGMTRNPSTPTRYCFRGDPNYMGQMAISLDPPPDEALSIDFIYQRAPRALTLVEAKDGTASVTEDDATVTGSGTAFTSSMVGSVIRFYSTGVSDPTGVVGQYPAVMERVVMSVTSATSLEMDEAADQSLADVKYVISDPVDIDQQVMATFFFREAEMQLRIAKRLKDAGNESGAYQMAMLEALEADSRYLGSQAIGGVPRRGYAPNIGEDQ